MRTPQLTVMGVVVLLAAGCSRADATRNANEAATEVRGAAAEAGERLADGWLMTKVQAQFFADRDVKSRYINVSAADGIVTLKGYVENDAAKQAALQIAQNTDGVTKVNDQLVIGVSPVKETFDAGAGTADSVTATGGNEYDAKVAANAAATAGMDDRITSMVQARFFLDPMLKTRVIDVQTRNGVITLRGQVADEMERAQALLLAKHINGVTRVEDALVTVPIP